MMLSLASIAEAAPNNAAPALSETQKQQIESVIHDYLVTNPEVLIEASQTLQKKQQQNLAKKSQTAIVSEAKNLFSAQSAVQGNAKGSVTLVEFFDYQCIHCKKMAPVLANLVKNDRNLRVVYKEFPIFGKSSEFAAKAALAAGAQGKYQAMHDALISGEKHLDKDMIKHIAKHIGLNMRQFHKDLKSVAIKNELAANRQLAEKLNLMGTPAFIVAATPEGTLKIGSQPFFVPGAASEESLQEMIQKSSSLK